MEGLGIIEEESIVVAEKKGYKLLCIYLKPTVPSCSLVLNIGLCIRYKLIRELDKDKFDQLKIDILLKEGFHDNKVNGIFLILIKVDRQVNDKERYLAALENPDIIEYLKRYT